jgi:hypothetical protein
MNMSDSLRTFADEDRYAATSHRNAPSERLDGAAGKAVALRSGLTASEGNAEASTPISLTYPAAFDRDTMRWMPLVIPLLGCFTAVLTGLMWMVAA